MARGRPRKSCLSKVLADLVNGKTINYTKFAKYGCKTRKSLRTRVSEARQQIPMSCKYYVPRASNGKVRPLM